MKKVGITGGIGCGKSTVVAEFRKLGIPAFVADEAGAACYQNSSFLSELRSSFGGDIFLTDGSVDKRRLADIVFADHQQLQRLNALVHPRVLAAFDDFCNRYPTAPYILFESAILYDYGLDRLMDRVVCVYLDLEERLRRLAARDQSSRQQLMARINNQMPAEEMMRRADYIVLNFEGNPRSRQVSHIDKMLRL
jgi:dephospho-CoA kinase